MHGFQCEGLFTPCNKEMCKRFFLVVNGSVLFSTAAASCNRVTDKSALASLQLKTASPITELCLCSNTCVVDADVYARSRGRLGLDYCVDGFNEEVRRRGDGFTVAFMLIGPSPSTHPLRFPRPPIPPLQIVVLQDSFEPQANKPATVINELNTPQYAYTNQEGDSRAAWVEAFNVRPSGVCGTQDGNYALVFSGHVARRIITIDLDIRFGGNAAYVVLLLVVVCVSAPTRCFANLSTLYLYVPAYLLRTLLCCSQF